MSKKSPFHFGLHTIYCKREGVELSSLPSKLRWSGEHKQDWLELWYVYTYIHSTTTDRLGIIHPQDAAWATCVYLKEGYIQNSTRSTSPDELSSTAVQLLLMRSNGKSLFAPNWSRDIETWRNHPGR